MSKKLRALDLFCSAGGATRGLMNAGFHVTGIDIKLQPRYCGNRFYQADALIFPLEGFDFIWASPPCHAFSTTTARYRKEGKVYPDLIEAIRERLVAQRTPFVIENVPLAPVRRDLVLCGSQFNLPIVRHRVFECSFQVGVLLPPCAHVKNPITVCGDGTCSTTRARRRKQGLPPDVKISEKRAAMQIHWTSRSELSLAIPPAYSEFIGRQVIDVLKPGTEAIFREVCA